METSSPPPQAIDLSSRLYRQLVYTLTELLPPPLDDTPAALRARNHAAIAKVAALLPVNANEADLAAQCIAARAQAEDILRLLRQNAGDIGLVMRLNAQYGSMVRTSLSVHGRLMRVQALRQKRQAVEGAANEDAWAQHIAERSMLRVVDPATNTQQAARPEPARAALPETARETLPEEAQAADVDQMIEKYVSEDGIISHDVAFETWLSAEFQGRGIGRPDGSHLYEVVREAMAEPHSAGRELPANGR
jgi:hypothetical protein